MCIKRLAIPVLIIVLISGCEFIPIPTVEEDIPNPFVGVWVVHSIDGETLLDTFGIPLVTQWSFSPNGKLKLDSEAVVDGTTVTTRFVGEYTYTETTYQLTLNVFGETETTSGRYEVEGGGIYLTLHDDDGSVIKLEALALP